MFLYVAPYFDNHGVTFSWKNLFCELTKVSLFYSLLWTILDIYGSSKFNIMLWSNISLWMYLLTVMYILQADERYKKEQNRMHISKWIRKSIHQYDDYKMSLEGLKSFFRDVKVFYTSLSLHFLKRPKWMFVLILCSVLEIACRKTLARRWLISCRILTKMKEKTCLLRIQSRDLQGAKTEIGHIWYFRGENSPFEKVQRKFSCYYVPK